MENVLEDTLERAMIFRLRHIGEREVPLVPLILMCALLAGFKEQITISMSSKRKAAHGHVTSIQAQFKEMSQVQRLSF